MNYIAVSFGAMGDSTYEYMIKLWLQSGKKEQRFRDMWDKSMNGGSTKTQKNPSQIIYISTTNQNTEII